MLLAAVAGCAPATELYVKNVHTVTAGELIRGGQPDEAGLIALQRTFGVQSVVNLNDRTADSERGIAQRLGLHYVAIPSNPFSPEADKIRAFLRVLHDPATPGPVYVHCKDGMDRTGVAVAVYRMVEQDWSLDSAQHELWRYQDWTHTVVFLAIPGFLRDVDTRRADFAPTPPASPVPPAPPASVPSPPPPATLPSVPRN